MTTPAIEITDLHAWYGESHVLHGINLTVQKGEVVTLLGRNGAGRTTTLRAIMGLTGAVARLTQDGEVTVDADGRAVYPGRVEELLAEADRQALAAISPARARLPPSRA